MFLRNGLKFDINQQHTIGDVQYPRGWFLDAGNRAALSITEVADIPRPDTSQFDSTENPDGTWTSTPRDQAPLIADTKASKLREMTEARRVATQVNITVGGKQYPADSEYREIISNLVSRNTRGRPIPGTLKGIDGVAVTLTSTLLGQIEDAYVTQTQAAWDRYWLRFDAIQSATTAAQITAVAW